MVCLLVDNREVYAFEVYRPACSMIGGEVMTRDVFFLPGKSFVASLVKLISEEHKHMFNITYRHDNKDGEDSIQTYVTEPTSARAISAQSYRGRDVGRMSVRGDGRRLSEVKERCAECRRIARAGARGYRHSTGRKKGM